MAGADDAFFQYPSPGLLCMARHIALVDSAWWLMQLSLVVSTSCRSAGEALRLIDQKDIIKSDFVLVSGDTVSNCDLGTVLAEHKRRRVKDKNAIMTMVRLGSQPPAKTLAMCTTSAVGLSMRLCGGERLEATGALYHKILGNGLFAVVCSGSALRSIYLLARARVRRYQRIPAHALLSLFESQGGRQVMRSAASPVARRRLGESELLVVLDTASGQLLKYEDVAFATGRRLALDTQLFSERDDVQIRSDLLDCQVQALLGGWSYTVYVETRDKSRLIAVDTTVHGAGVCVRT